MSFFSKLSLIDQTIDELFSPKPVKYLNHEIFKKVLQFNQENQENRNQISILKCEYLQPEKCHSQQQQNFINASKQHFPSAFLISPKNKSPNISFDQSICIVYLHGFSSYCFQGLYLLPYIAKMKSMSLCLYDLRGHGKNQQAPISFGIHQSEQLQKLIEHLSKVKKFKKIVIWGRSMGATTCLQYILNANKYDKNQKNRVNAVNAVKMVILDSAFASFRSVCYQIINKGTNNALPNFIVDTIVNKIFSRASESYKLDLDQINIAEKKPEKIKINVPFPIFLSSSNDELICPSNTQKILKHYPKLKDSSINPLNLNGSFTHNQQRPSQLLQLIFKQIEKISMIPQLEQSFHWNPRKYQILPKGRFSNSQIKKGIELCVSTVKKPRTPVQMDTKSKSEKQIPRNIENSIKEEQNDFINSKQLTNHNERKTLKELPNSSKAPLKEKQRLWEDIVVAPLKINCRQKIKTFKTLVEEEQLRKNDCRQPFSSKTQHGYQYQDVMGSKNRIISIAEIKKVNQQNKQNRIESLNQNFTTKFASRQFTPKILPNKNLNNIPYISLSSQSYRNNQASRKPMSTLVQNSYSRGNSDRIQNNGVYSLNNQYVNKNKSHVDDIDKRKRLSINNCVYLKTPPHQNFDSWNPDRR